MLEVRERLACHSDSVRKREGEEQRTREEARETVRGIESERWGREEGRREISKKQTSQSKQVSMD